jgi:hypothetical protein
MTGRTYRSTFVIADFGAGLSKEPTTLPSPQNEIQISFPSKHVSACFQPGLDGGEEVGPHELRREMSSSKENTSDGRRASGSIRGIERGEGVYSLRT